VGFVLSLVRYGRDSSLGRSSSTPWRPRQGRRGQYEEAGGDQGPCDGRAIGRDRPWSTTATSRPRIQQVSGRTTTSNLVPKLMTPRSSLRPPHVLRVPRDQLRDNPAGHGHRATNAHGHCQRAHLHIPAGTVITPVASGRRDRHRPGSRLRNRDVCSPPRCLVGSCTPNLPFRDQAASRGSMGRLADGGRRVRPARGAAGSGVARSRR
jgi:hypothetical protein